MRMPLTAVATLLMLGTGAMAQTSVTGQPATGGASSSQSGSTPPAVTRPNTDHAEPGRAATTGTVGNAQLEKGANSFTEGQVRGRLEQAGLKEVQGLNKDGDGIWHGQAQRDGKPVTVGFDYKGNIAVQ